MSAISGSRKVESFFTAANEKFFKAVSFNHFLSTLIANIFNFGVASSQKKDWHFQSLDEVMLQVNIHTYIVLFGSWINNHNSCKIRRHSRT